MTATERQSQLEKQREVVRSSRQRRGYSTERARARAELRAARWVRENRPDVWAQFRREELLRVADERRVVGQ